MSEEFLTIQELEQFFQSEVDELYTYLEILCKNPDDASDVLQSVFEKFIEQVKKGRIVRATASHYLKRMGRNEFFDKFRAAKNTIPLPTDNLLHVDDSREKIEENSRLIRIVLLETLSDPEFPADIAEILRLRLVDDRNVDQICKQADISRATAYRMVEKGLSILGKSFEKAGLHISELEL